MQYCAKCVQRCLQMMMFLFQSVHTMSLILCYGKRYDDNMRHVVSFLCVCMCAFCIKLLTQILQPIYRYFFWSTRKCFVINFLGMLHVSLLGQPSKANSMLRNVEDSPVLLCMYTKPLKSEATMPLAGKYNRLFKQQCLKNCQDMCFEATLSMLSIKYQKVTYCILRGRIKGFNSAIYAIKCQQVVIELWLGSYSTVVG